MDTDKLKDLWIEKYRPKTLDEICLDDSTKARLNEWGNNIPHLLLVGNVGIGKTTLAQILVLDILKCDYLYINASDENGVETMRNKVTGFVQTKSLDGNLKVVILDEADAITLQGQDILRNMMESYADNARFILTGNHRHKISIALQSRCQRLDPKFTKKDMVHRIVHILQLEKIKPNKADIDGIVEIVKKNFPDLRASINEVQRAYIGGKFDFDQVPDNSELISYTFFLLTTNQTLELRKYLIEREQSFQCDWDRLLRDMLNYIYDNPSISDNLKKMAIMELADHLEKSTRVIDKEINFFACMLNIETKL